MFHRIRMTFSPEVHLGPRNNRSDFGDPGLIMFYSLYIHVLAAMTNTLMLSSIRFDRGFVMVLSVNPGWGCRLQ